MPTLPPSKPGLSAGGGFGHARHQAKPQDRACFGQSFAEWTAVRAFLPKTSSQPSIGRLSSKALATAKVPEALVLPPVAFGRHRYLTDCDARGNVPVPLRCITGHSKAIAAAGRDLVDSELLAIAGAAQEMDAVEELDLRGNRMLSDASLGPLLRQLCVEPLAGSLRRLLLNNCVRAGAVSATVLVTLVDVAGMLVHLDLGHVAIPARLQLPLCAAIGDHPRLRTVCLAEAGFKEKSLTVQCIGSLLDSGTVDTLDLSWNCFDAAVFSRLGERIVSNSTLRSLRVQNCSSSVREGDPPVASLFEHLAKDRSLTHLDVSMNHIDFRTALIIEDCLDSQKNLEELCLANNPLGVPGMRSIMRLLSSPGSGLRRFDLDGCYRGDNVPSEKSWQEGRKSFNLMEPNGKYVLDLAQPSQRSLLRMVYKLLFKFGVAPDSALSGISYVLSSGGKKRNAKWDHLQKADGLLQVPMEGTVTFNLKVEPALELINKGFQESDLAGVVDRYYALLREKFEGRKAAPVFACWHQLDGQESDQDVFLNAMSKGFSLTVPILDYMSHSCAACANAVISKLSPCLPNTEFANFCTHMIFPTLQDILVTDEKMATFLDFNPANPSGHYRLNLDICSAHAVAERLRLLDRWEQIVDARHKRLDVSQHQNRSHFRNESFQGRPLFPQFPSVADWPLPESALFEADYVTAQRPGQSSTAIPNHGLWKQLMKLLVESPCDSESKLKVLRSVSHYLWLNCLQVRHLMGCFRSQSHRVDVLVMFFSRIVDMHDEKVFRVKLCPEEVAQVQKRLGYATMFPYLQPENMKFALDLSYPDQRLVCNFLILLEAKEKVGNLQEYEMRYNNGQVDTLGMGIPRSWEELQRLPTEGVFHCIYQCAPEDRRFEYRKKFAESATAFSMNVSEDGVSWWTGLTEAPADVLELLSWLLTKFASMDEAFTKATSSKLLNLRQLEDFLLHEGFRKFHGPDQHARISGVFRYLDTGREGTVSQKEFNTMQQLWNEMDLCLREFMQFVSHAFGGGDMEVVWDELDEDLSGELSMDEWTAAVERIGYFGPADIVFKFIDSDDDGLIQPKELAILESYAMSQRRATQGPVESTEIMQLARPSHT